MSWWEGLTEPEFIDSKNMCIKYFVIKLLFHNFTYATKEEIKSRP